MFGVRWGNISSFNTQGTHLCCACFPEVKKSTGKKKKKKEKHKKKYKVSGTEGGILVSTSSSCGDLLVSHGCSRRDLDLQYVPCNICWRMPGRQECCNIEGSPMQSSGNPHPYGTNRKFSHILGSLLGLRVGLIVNGS